MTFSQRNMESLVITIQYLTFKRLVFKYLFNKTNLRNFFNFVKVQWQYSCGIPFQTSEQIC